MAEETKDPAAITAPLAAPAEGETWEAQQQKKLEEAFKKRNIEAIALRSAILTKNGMRDDTKEIDPNEAVKNCCG